MSIPERFLRIARYKLTEFRERIDRLDEEARTAEESRSKDPRKSAEAELRDAIAQPRTPAAPPVAAPAEPAPRLRSPSEIATGHPAPSRSPQPASNAALLPHYRLLGLDADADYISVQVAYQRLAARCEPARFEAGSPEERQATDLRARLEESFRLLREALDPTTRRFDLLELDAPPRP